MVEVFIYSMFLVLVLCGLSLVIWSIDDLLKTINRIKEKVEYERNVLNEQ